MIIKTIKYVVFWMSVFLLKFGVLKTYKPQNIITGTTINKKKHCKLFFWSYMQAHKDIYHTNNWHMYWAEN